MVKRPKVSIIIPIYNVEDYLSRCLESVMNQTLSDIEIIGVNDGTKDNSVEIMREYMALDSRMQLVEKENGGFSGYCALFFGRTGEGGAYRVSRFLYFNRSFYRTCACGEGGEYAAAHGQHYQNHDRPFGAGGGKLPRALYCGQ